MSWNGLQGVFCLASLIFFKGSRPLKIRLHVNNMPSSFSQIDRNLWQQISHFHVIEIGWGWVGTDVFRFSIVITTAYHSLDMQVKNELLFIITVSVREMLDAVTNEPWHSSAAMIYRNISVYPCNNPMWVSLGVDSLPPHNHSGIQTPPISWLSHLSLGILCMLLVGEEKKRWRRVSFFTALAQK